VPFSSKIALVDPTDTNPGQHHWLEKVSLIFFPVWGIGTLVFLARLLVGRLLLVLYCRRLKPANDPVVDSSVLQIARILGYRRSIRILESQSSATPVALGLFRPTIILPIRTIAELDSRQRDVILAHEIAHLSSYDPAWTVTMDVVLAVLWWHPAVWYLKKQLNHVNEHYADDASLLVEDGPTSLAKCLVDLGARLLHEKKVEWVSLEGIPMAGRNFGSRNFRSSLGQRVARLLSLNDRNHPSFARPMRNSLKMCGSLLIVTSVIFGQTWANSGSYIQGESTVSVFKKNWKKSLAGIAMISFLGSPNSYADDTKQDDSKGKKIVVELKEAKPLQVHQHVKKKDVKVFEVTEKKADGKNTILITVGKNGQAIIGEAHGGKKANALFVVEGRKNGNVEVEQTIRLHKKDGETKHQHAMKAQAVLGFLVDGEHESIELSGSPEEIKKKIAIYLKKHSAYLLKIAKSGDKKKVIEAKKKYAALKKVLSGIHLDGGKGKVRIVISGGGNDKGTAIRRSIVIEDGQGKGKIHVLTPHKIQENIHVIRANQLDKGKLKLLLEKASKSDTKLNAKKLMELIELAQKSHQSNSQHSSFRRRVFRSGASQQSAKDIAKLHEKISHLKNAAESLKAAGLKEKAQELLVTAEKMAAAANKRLEELKQRKAEGKQRIIEVRQRAAEAQSRARQVQARGRTEHRRIEIRRHSTEETAESRSHRDRIVGSRRSSSSNVNAELLQVIRQLSKEIKELRKEVNDLKKKVNN